MMNDFKKVSVVMCSFNGEKYIKEQLDSIIAQSYPIFEIIVQDDCSTDQTWSILQEYELQYPMIQCFKNKVNIGADNSFKNTFFLSKGDYIAPSDQDDIWYPNKLEVLIDLIGDNKLAFSRSKILYSDGNFGEFPFIYPKTSEQTIWRRVMAGHSCLFHSSMLSCINQSIGINICYDFAICQIGYTFNSFIYTNEYLQIWRRHSEAMTKSVMNSDRNEVLIQVNGNGKFSGLIYSIRNLVLNNKSVGIEKYFSEIAEFQTRIKGRKHIIQLCYLLANQSLYSYFKAACICLYYRRKFFPNIETNTLSQKLSFISYSFRYPFTFWNEQHSFEAL